MPEPTPQFVDAPGPIFVDAQGPKFVDAPGPTPQGQSLSTSRKMAIEAERKRVKEHNAPLNEAESTFSAATQPIGAVPAGWLRAFGGGVVAPLEAAIETGKAWTTDYTGGGPADAWEKTKEAWSHRGPVSNAIAGAGEQFGETWARNQKKGPSQFLTDPETGEQFQNPDWETFQKPWVKGTDWARTKIINPMATRDAVNTMLGLPGTAAAMAALGPKLTAATYSTEAGLNKQEEARRAFQEKHPGIPLTLKEEMAALTEGVGSGGANLLMMTKVPPALQTSTIKSAAMQWAGRSIGLGLPLTVVENTLALLHDPNRDPFKGGLATVAMLGAFEAPGLKGGIKESLDRRAYERTKTRINTEADKIKSQIDNASELNKDPIKNMHDSIEFELDYMKSAYEKDPSSANKKNYENAFIRKVALDLYVQKVAAGEQQPEAKNPTQKPVAKPLAKGAPNASEVQGPVEVGKLPSGEESARVEGRQGVGPVEPGTEVTGASEVKVEAPKVEPVSVKLKDGTKNTFEHPEDVAEVQATRDALKEKISQIKEMPMTTKERAAAIKDLVIDHDTAIRNIAEKTKAREAEENPVVPIEDRNNVDRRHLEQAVDVERRAQDRRASRRAEKASEKPIGEMSPEEMRDEITRLRQDRLLDEKIPGMWNRIAFEREYQEGQPVATLDVKGLKEANKHGQVVGDTLLIHVGETLDKAAKGLGGNAAHINGDEYTLLGESAEHLEKIINETNTRLKEKPILIRDEQGEIVDQLVGELHYGTGTSPEASDRAMAAAKARRKQQESLTDVQDQTGRSGLPGGLPEVTSGSEAGTVVAKPVETPDPKAAEQVPVVKPSDTKEIGKAIDEGKPISFVKPSGDPVKDYFEQIRMRPTLMPSEGMTHGVERGVHFALMRQVRGMHIADEVSCSNLLRSAAAEYPLESRIEARKYLDSLDAGTPSDKTKLSPDAQKYIGFHDEIMKQWGDAFKEAKANKALDLGEDWEVNLQRVPRRVVDLEGKGIGNPRGALKTKGSSENARSMVAGVDAEGNRYVMGLDGAKARVYQDGEIVGDARQIELAKEGKPAVYRFGGKDLKIGQATVDELEQHTGLKYLQDPLASTMFSLNDLANVNRTFRVLDGLKKQGIVKKTIVAPDGWVPIELGNFKDMSAPEGVAGVLNGLARQLQPRGKQGEGLGARIAKISRLLVNVGFVQPMVHGPNMLDHGFSGRGLSQWVSRDGYRNLSEGFQSAAAMANDTPTRNMILALDAAANPLGSPLAMKILNAGGRYMNISPERTAMLRVYNDAIMRSAAEHPAYWDDLLGKMGIKGIDKITDIVSTVSDKVWMADNMLRATQYLKMAKKMHIDVDNPAEFQKAIREVDRAGYVDYDIPNVGKMGKFGDWMQTSPEFLFARYHFGAMRILKNKCVDTLSAANPGAWNSKLGKQRIIKNADKLAGLVVLSTIIYPALDFMVQQIADDKNVEFRRGGTTHLAELFHKTLVTQEKTPGQALSTLVTPAPHLALAVSMFNNFTNPATGQKIIHQSDLWSAKQNLGEGEYGEAAKDASRLLTDPLLYSASLVGPVQTGMNAFRDYRGEEEKDITDKTRRFVSYLLGAKHKAENPEDRANRNMVREHKKTVKERNR